MLRLVAANARLKVPMVGKSPDMRQISRDRRERMKTKPNYTINLALYV
jgi:hypothetical protein